MPSTLTSRTFLRKFFFLPVFVLGFFGVAPFVYAATITVHPQSTVSNSTWQAVGGFFGGDAVCVDGDSASGSTWSGWACVNDQSSNAASGSAVSNDGSNTYVRSQSSTTSSDEGVVGFGSELISAGNTITNISISSSARQHNCNSCANYQLYYRIGSSGAKTFGASHVPPSTSSYSTFTDAFAVSLTPLELDQLQIGFIQTQGNGSSRIRITQIYATITYSLISDFTAPAAVSDLAAGSPTASSMRLDWTAPGDDGASGTATSYDIRYSTANITDANWGSATQVSGEPAPLVAGSPQSMTVSGLSAGTLYYFALKTSDEVSNISPLSNVPNGTTLPPPPPTVTTNAASGITTTSATLNGSANPNGYSTTGWFRYSATNPGSCNDTFGARLPASGGSALGSGSVSVAYSNSASGLTSGVTYYYCAIAENIGGKVFGNIVSFFVPLPAAPIVSLSANPASVVSGYSTTLTWSSSGADSCSASAVPANAQWTANGGAFNGSQIITNMTVNTLFTLTCTNLGGSTSSSATVTVTPPPNVSGHAWAGSGSNDGTNSNPGIGWIKMSGIAGDGSPYGVLVSSANPGVLSGYAWANPNDGAQNHIGWISFNAADVVGCPTAPCTPTLNRSTGAVTGWARACSVFASGCSGALKADSERGGWDGWIRLWRDSDGDGIVNTDTGAAASDYGVSASECNWSGYAWGGGITIGWIHFGGASYPVTGSGDGCTSSADLTAGPVSPTSAIAGTAITLSSTISNTGVGSTGAGFTNLFQFDNDADHAAVTATMTDTSPAVTAGGTDVSQVAYTFSTPGTWYVRACADNDVSFIGTIAESNEGNNCGAWTEVAVALPLLTGSFSASPDTIDPGGSSTLTWTSNATTCVGQGFSTGVGNPANGSAVVTPTTPGPNGYQIICSKSGYSDLVLATTVTVISVTATISAKPTCISGGGSSKIFWSISPVSQIQSGSCRLSGPGLSSNPLTVSPDGSAPNASPQTATVNTKTPYTILCTTTGGSSVSKSVIVDVSRCWAEF